VKEMKKIFALLCAITLVLTVAGTANAILFDFEDLDPGAGATEVSTYMTDIMNSYGFAGSVFATAPEVANGIAPLGTDNFIQNMAPSEVHEFSFYFEHPLSSVSFDWGVESDPFVFTADGVEVFSEPYHLWESDNIEIVFADYGLGPVSLLGFHDGYGGEIAMDNLEVTPTPEPATLLLLGSGLMSFAGVGRKRFMKRQHNT